LRIAVLHSSLNACGGGERLALTAIEAFKERGWEVTLATIEPTDWDRIISLWDKIPLPDHEETLVPFKVRKFGIYMRLVSSLLVPTLKREHDVVINTHGDVLVTNADITYMHYPTFALWDESYHKYEHGFWRMYFTPYYFVQKRLVNRHFNTLLLTNSRFSQRTIMRVSGRRAIVVYPPVDIDRYLVLEGGRRDSVVTIGRFAPEKRYEVILEIARRMPNLEFHIIGSVHGISTIYYNKIRALVESMNLKNVYLHPNDSQRVLEDTHEALYGGRDKGDNQDKGL
jgi:alpha-1,2-mannosyltransferase